MKKRLLIGFLAALLLLLPSLMACTTSTTTSSQSSSPSTALTTSTPATSSTVSPPPSTTAANWWDKFGQPQYGGTLNIRLNSLSLDLDPATTWGGLYQYFGDYLWQGNWTLDRSIWGFQSSFIPDQYWVGNLVDTWQMTDPKTLTVTLRQGVHWQNIAPVNGREFVADDVQQHYDRILGTGSGYTTPNPFSAPRFFWLDKVVATDKYTVVFYFKEPISIGLIGLAEHAGQNWVEAPEVAKLDNGFKDPKYAIGTGPWILSNFTSGSSANYIKNPDYWGKDPRYPDNTLPYADKLNTIVIQDNATASAALRTGKIDILDGINWQSAKTIARTNPELQQATLPTNGTAICMRVDVKPFTDIKVREALQLAVNLPQIAQSHYGGTVDPTPCLIFSPAFKGYIYPYSDWSQELKDEYSYNPTKAKELLSEAGYPNGFNTDIVASAIDDIELLQIFKSEFQDIGVNMTIKTMDPGTEMNVAIARKEDQMITHTCARVFPPQMDLSAFTAQDMANFGNVKDDNYTKLYNDFLYSTTPEQSQQYAREAEKYALEQHWLVTTFSNDTYNFWQPYLKGYSGEALTGSLWARLWTDQNTHTSEGQ